MSDREVSSTNIITTMNIPLKNPELWDTTGLTYALRIHDIFFSYHRLTKKRSVLNGVSINVLKGRIYALLGPSGCGKTTLLKCVTGTFVPDRGNIINALKSSKWKIPGPGVGYMPQELALLTDLTTQETLWLFGTINGVSPEILTENIKRLRKLFDLAPGNRIIANLSGGQMRRVSLACALLHEPPLLILDEPTVGLDPVLRKIIWDYMADLTRTKKTTILLTTHYIEEAKDAHTVGLMRDGKLLAENSPRDLLNQFNEKSLERCFYRICVNNEMEIEKSTTLTGYVAQPDQWANGKNKTAQTPLKHRGFPRNFNLRFSLMIIVPALIRKNVKLLLRQSVLLYFQFLLPSLSIYFCGKCLGTKVFDLPMGIFNEEYPQDLSLELLRHISSSPIGIQQHFFYDKNLAMDFVKSGRSVMTLHIPPDFSKCLRNRIALGIYSTQGDIQCASVYFYADNTNQIISLELQNTLIRSFEFFEMEYIRNYTYATPLVATIPVKFEKPIYGDMNSSFSVYMWPGVLLITIHFLAAVLAGFNLMSEKANGAMGRFSVCGVTKIEIFFAQLLTSMVIVCGQVFLMLATQFIAFKTNIYGSYVLIATIVVLQGFCGVLLAFFISALTHNVLGALLGGVGIYFSTLFLCGLMWPLEGMPTALRVFSRYIPCTQTIEALRAVMSRGWGIEHFQVQMGLLSVISWSAIFLVAALLTFKAQK